ncbi:DUF3471 domain-containing protein [Flaviaesturariibacter flavus]|uniref:DUF3471 domain-containing protein n=1 Tax=Flaviaesturariibacter flavus TaxID=2502780 RepID=A0A4R1B6E3_9BACT|nr:DUF3471 domain-containing protein [Flaviaesturariibacter flavus]TCJ13240.1 DUF3471 domain-containing protein [Flaviaesturariibacter flavus]
MKKILLAAFAFALSPVLFAQSPGGLKPGSVPVSNSVITAVSAPLAAASDTARLAAYAGTYSCPNFHRKITIRVKDGTLEAEATGQGSILLDALDDKTFRFDGADVTLEFDAKAKTMKLTQHGKELLFTKE